MDRITPDNAEVLVWLEKSLSKQDYYQQILHKVIEKENVKVRYLTYNRYQIEDGECILPTCEIPSTHILTMSISICFPELLSYELNNITHYHEYFPCALVLYQDEVSRKLQMKILFSGNSLHSLAATVNLADNFQLQLLTQDSTNYTIGVTNAPMHK